MICCTLSSLIRNFQARTLFSSARHHPTSLPYNPIHIVHLVSRIKNLDQHHRSLVSSENGRHLRLTRTRLQVSIRAGDGGKYHLMLTANCCRLSFELTLYVFPSLGVQTALSNEPKNPCIPRQRDHMGRQERRRSETQRGATL